MAKNDNDDDNGDKLPAGTAGRDTAVAEFLARAAAVPAPRNDGRGRLLFGMDATASREPTWDRACRIQGEMFEAAAQLGGLDVQLVFYRGLGECKASPWLGSADALLKRMAAVTCAAGETQIAKLLRHAIAETRKRKVSALVFVGDCMEEKLDTPAGLAGELGMLGVPCFMFHEGGDPVAARAFREIARLTRGAYCAFDGSSAAQLRALLGAVAAYAAGGRRALEHYGRNKGELIRLLTRQVG